jgi:hypothetical protein
MHISAEENTQRQHFNIRFPSHFITKTEGNFHEKSSMTVEAGLHFKILNITQI